VTDKGKGIAPENQAKLFDRYYQAEPETMQNAGMGLGLYISTQIIKRHHGNIGVKSKPGSGSTFWFTLPLAV
jgi:signal transduction histidine kinase